MNSNSRSLWLWLIVAIALLSLFNIFQDLGGRANTTKVPYSQFIADVNAGKVSEVLISGSSVRGEYSDKTRFYTYAPREADYVDLLQKKGVTIKAQPTEAENPSLISHLLSWLPFLLLIAVWIFFMRQMQSGSGRAMGFGKSKAKLLTEHHGRVTFEDVAGIEEAKEELTEVVEFLRDPQKFQRLGGRIPHGALLVGPPGTGKTLLARSVAGEANVPFFTISGSDFVEMFVGVGASRVRDMFEQAKRSAPCIIFIDEIDAVGRHRGSGVGGGNDEREQTLNQLLVEMDGFEANESVIIIAATNRPDVLDKALLRPGRFDRQVVVPLPDIGGREKILNVHVRNVPIGPDVDLKTVARGTPGFSGADLANLVNEAALMAARRSMRIVTQQEFEDAKDKVMMGSERRSMVMSDDEKEATAYHEAGHAIVGMHMPGHDPLHKVTIIPRGRALGVTMSLPEADRLSMNYQYCVANLASLFGGREAEVLLYGPEKINSGASSDIQQATNLARSMVMEWGMSAKLGPVLYGANEQDMFSGRPVSNMSDETSKLIDAEVRNFIDTGEQTARKILTDNIEDLHTLAKGLLEYETLSGAEVKALLAGTPPQRGSDDDDAAAKGPTVPSAGNRSKKAPKKDKPQGDMEPQPQS